MKHEELMLDLETYAVSPRALVLSVGAVAFSFNDAGLDQKSYRAVLDRREQAVRLKRDVDAATMRWWEQQAPEALFNEPQVPVRQVLDELRGFVAEHTVGEAAVRPWSNGADFDLVILGTLYHEVELQRPWRYYQQRCFRTLMGLFPREYKYAVKHVPRNPLKHDALADAEWQARVAYEMWAAGCLWGRE